MLSLEILQEKSVRNQTTITQIKREYLQNLFLNFFYREKEAWDFLFKGGTCLRIVHKSPRYSEDLDFTSNTMLFSTFERLLEKTLLQMERLGLNPEIIECKSTTGGCLAIFNTTLYQQSIRIDIQASLRKRRFLKPKMVAVGNEYIPSYNIGVLPDELLVEEKIEALISRAKPRDVYDLYLIMRSQVLRPKLSKSKREKITKVLKGISERELGRDLKPFLPQSHRAIIKHLKPNLEEELRY